MKKNPVYLLIRFAKIASLLALIGYLFYVYIYLPQDVAWHFNEFGHADDYINKGNFFLITGVFAVIFNVVLSLLGRMVILLPGRFFAVPNRSFWLASSHNRRAMNDVLRNWLNIFMILVNLFLIVSLAMLLKLNQLESADIADYYWVMVLALVAFTGWLLFLPVRLLYSKPVPVS